jgi:2-dehydro-3-deoxyphosphooctonate aldolase (KDO 8-P synthase)
MRNNSIVQVGRGEGAVRFGADLPLALIAGPCQLESRAHALEMAGALKEIAARRGVGLVFKTSYDKANRTSGAGARMSTALVSTAKSERTFSTSQEIAMPSSTP